MADANATTTPRYASDLHPSHADGPAPRLELTPVNTALPVDQRPAEVLRLAQDAFAKTDKWVVFYREMLGVEGVVRRLFTTPEEMRRFEQSEEFMELQEMVAAIRSQDTSKGDSAEPERMITIRLPKSLHDVLKCEADETNLSINKLCISKLLQRIDSRYVPIQQGRRRGRRPGPQGPRSKNAETDQQEVTLEKAVIQPSSNRLGSESAQGTQHPYGGNPTSGNGRAFG
jgi:predicted HicB family RNase H-like nuclease